MHAITPAHLTAWTKHLVKTATENIQSTSIFDEKEKLWIGQIQFWVKKAHNATLFETQPIFTTSNLAIETMNGVIQSIRTDPSLNEQGFPIIEESN